MITISNSKWSAAVNPLGAELSSFQSRETGEEFIWQRNPDVWAGSAPILFPLVGMLKGGLARFDGRNYELPKHGIVRKEVFEVVDQSESAATFRFQSSEETAGIYPFQFIFEAEFQCLEEGITVIHRVINTGTRIMPFSLGAHPAIALDLDNHNIEDYYIEFNRPETLDRYRLNADGLAELGQKKYLDNTSRMDLTSDLFNDDAFIFSDIASAQVRICRKDSNWRVALDTGGAPDLGIWSKPGGQAYVCIEPWYGFNDFADFTGEFSARKNVQSLEPTKTFEQQYQLLPSS